ncbi:hypothetical protein FUA26_07380 [Seonamhaeicola algicola]|uniref:Uncharacterized protein n=1 Tax=Seonamhaeicola algicola TaxID=1719036 RepID=A0A5C7AU77_9FLAO|nr:hypothetical protein [Seonamhaeicola algicola]TXE11877.1 hypothetical protein FUA26_07380 [Seonamhaeicola algicola]
MPYNLFLLPIITGYLILTFSLLFKYNLQRLSRNRILFESVGIGVIIVIFGFLIRTVLETIYKPIITIPLNYLNVFPIEKPTYFWTVVFSCLIGLFITWCINKYIRRNYKTDEPIIWAIKQNGDEIERLFKDSVEKGFAMQITLKNNKVYIGFSETIPIPQKTNYLTITPIISGYRDSETKQLHITTDYFKVVDEFIEDLNEHNDEKIESINLNTDIIIKQDEILSASVYEQKIYDKFNKQTE